MKPICAFFLLLMLASMGVAQTFEPSILMMTGQVIQGKVTGEDSLYIYYDLKKSNGKTKPKKLDWERVFSITDEQNVEQVVYMADTTIGNYFTVDEMRYYIKGEQDAINGYKANWAIFLGVPITGGLGYVLNSSPLVFAVPFVYMVGAALPKYKMEGKSITDASLLRQPAYVLGYERTARTKRLYKSLISGVVGAGLGVAVGQLTD
ncbi:MAG: hypothetical protein R2813_06715 [Flavobacteriales bacterium]